jgi:hypothetical protein
VMLMFNSRRVPKARAHLILTTLADESMICWLRIGVIPSWVFSPPPSDQEYYFQEKN